MSPELLHDRRYFRPVWQLEHANLLAALKPWMLTRSGLSLVFVVANLAALGLIGWHWWAAGLDWLSALSMVALGMTAGLVLLMPVHEHVHALVYRTSGATDVRVHYNWRALGAYCVADRFVMRGAAFELVCLAPFLMINPPLALAALVTSGKLALFLSGALLMHIGACSGDLALVNWLNRNGGNRIWTYDDVAAGTSYFYYQEKPDGEL